MFFASSAHQRALRWIEDGVAARMPLLVLSGPVGTGKTVLLRQLLNRHRTDWRIGLISTFGTGHGDVLAWARSAFDLPAESDDPAQIRQQLHRFAASSRAKGQIAVLIVDEAQALGTKGIAALVELIRDATGLTLLLVGQPELDALLSSSELRHLNIAPEARGRLTPLSPEDTAHYLAHRLAASGAHQTIFDPAAAAVLHAYAHGVPRRINVMADYSLVMAAADDLPRIEADWLRDLLDEATLTGPLAHLGRPEEIPRPTPATPTVLPPPPVEAEVPQRVAPDPPPPAPEPAPPAKIAAPEPEPARKPRTVWPYAAAAMLALAAAGGVLMLRPDAPTLIASVPAETPSPLPPVGLTAEPTTAALMQQALEAETADPAAAAILYARAALRGRDRAAYFLGQLAETGLAGPVDPAAARQWYGLAPDLPAAQRRLQALPPPTAPATELQPPVPLFQARSDAGSEMIWQSAGAPAARFRVETFAPGEATAAIHETEVPGLILPAEVGSWRVTAIGQDGRESPPSALVRMIE